MEAIIATYSSWIDTNPILTKCITAMILCGLSDILSQIITKILDRRNQILRTLRFVIWGCFSGVLGHYYITLINYYIPGTSVGDVVMKVLIDQMIWSPFANSLFFFTISFLESPRAQPRAGLDSIYRNLLPTQKANLVIWIPVQAVNFFLVPPKYQLFIINSVSLFWNCYLSIVSNRKIEYSEIKTSDTEVN